VLSYSKNKSSDKVLVATVRKFLALNGTLMFTAMFTGARLNQFWLEALFKLYIIPIFVVLKVSEFFLFVAFVAKKITFKSTACNCKLYLCTSTRHVPMHMSTTIPDSIGCSTLQQSEFSFCCFQRNLMKLEMPFMPDDRNEFL
jgi:hypothetical protein